MALMFSVLIGVPFGVISAVRRTPARLSAAGDQPQRPVDAVVLARAAGPDGVRARAAGYRSTTVSPTSILGRSALLRDAGAGGRLPQFRADHAADTVLDAGGAAAGLHPYRAVQGRLGADRSTYEHALRNALLPVVTTIGIEAAFLIGGLIVTETVFNIPGVARFLVEAIRSRDYPIVQNLVMFIAVVVVMVNFFVDLAYMLVIRASGWESRDGASPCRNHRSQRRTAAGRR